MSQLQFPGTEQLGPRPAQPERTRSKTVDALTYLAIDRFPHEAPVGMRGSIPERVDLAKRISRRERQRDRWKSYQSRVADSYESDSNDFEIHPDLDEPAMTMRPGPSRELHPRTGLPARGEIGIHDVIGFGSEPIVNPEVSFRGGTSAAWRLHARTAFVPTPALHTQQGSISAQRLHETIEEPRTRATPRFQGEGKLGPELPRVYHSHMLDRYSIVDGNHRLSADLLQGKLFSEVRLAEPKDVPKMSETNIRVKAARRRAESRPDIDQDEVQRRSMRLEYGTENF